MCYIDGSSDENIHEYFTCVILMGPAMRTYTSILISFLEGPQGVGEIQMAHGVGEIRIGEKVIGEKAGEWYLSEFEGTLIMYLMLQVHVPSVSVMAT